MVRNRSQRQAKLRSTCFRIPAATERDHARSLVVENREDTRVFRFFRDSAVNTFVHGQILHDFLSARNMYQ